MIQEFKKVWKPYVIGMLWMLGLLWPMLGVHPDGTLTFQKTFTVWSYIVAGSFVILLVYVLNASGSITFITNPVSKAVSGAKSSAQAMPSWVWIVTALQYFQLAS